MWRTGWNSGLRWMPEQAECLVIVWSGIRFSRLRYYLEKLKKMKKLLTFVKMFDIIINAPCETG